ncbi:MAG: hypothetical protein F2864_08815, partial [Actinobacteria bacterium]|nr:hypothetical protein [Actinomycetota bacterium]
MSDAAIPAVSSHVSTELLNASWATAGLTSAEVDQRVAAGQVNTLPHAPDRTVGQIIRANVINPVNGIVGFMLVLIIIADGIGPDMLFGGVIIT